MKITNFEIFCLPQLITDMKFHKMYKSLERLKPWPTKKTLKAE